MIDSLNLDFDEDWVPPARSRLVTLKPMGAGTQMLESVSSLLVRIARAHTVKPLDLLNREIVPRTDIQLRRPSSSFVNTHAKTANGLGKYAHEIVDALEQLTGQTGLASCSFLPWRELLASNGNSLLHARPCWCPTCFQEWRAAGHEPYFPLAWFCEQVAVCPAHECVLIDRCTQCGRQQPFVTRHAYLDYCSYCGEWLGKKNPANRRTSVLPQHAIARAKAIGELIVVGQTPEALTLGAQGRHIAVITTLVQRYFGGVRVEAERRLGIRPHALQSWLGKHRLLSLKSLFELSERVGVSPVTLLRNDPTTTLDLSQRTPMKPIKHRPPVSKRRLDDLRKVLDGIARNGPHHLALTDVAKTLGEKYTFLRYRCPDECARISAAHLKFKSDNSEAKLAASVTQSRKIMMRLLSSKQRITRKIVRAELAAHRISIACPEVRAALRRAVSDFVSAERLRRAVRAQRQ